MVKKPVTLLFHSEVSAYPEDSWRDIEILLSATLAELNLRVRSVFHLEYDYGTTWYFNIRLAEKRSSQKARTSSRG